MICSLMDKMAPDRTIGEHETLIKFVDDRPGHDHRYAMDSSKIREELGWAPRETFESGLARTVRWYIDNRSWWERIRSGSYRGERLGLVSSILHLGAGGQLGRHVAERAMRARLQLIPLCHAQTTVSIASKRDELRVVADHGGSPTSTADLAEAILRIRPTLGSVHWGTYHFAGTDETTWHGFASRIVEAQVVFTGRRPKVKAINTADFPTKARWPQNSALDRSRFAMPSGSSPSRGSRRLTAQSLSSSSGSSGDTQGHHSRRRGRHAASSPDARHLQTTSARLRQADDLLSAVDPNARRYPRHLADHDAGARGRF